MFNRLITLPPALTSEQEQKLGKQILKGSRKAKHALILPNIRLVKWIARSYQDRGVDIDDLVSAGILGLIKAADKYDHRRGKFSVCAWFYIGNAMWEEICKHGHGISRPIHYMDQIRKLKRMDADFEVAGRGTMSESDVAESMGVGIAVARRLRNDYVTVISMHSLETGGDPNSGPVARIADTNGTLPDAVASSGDDCGMVRKCIRRLPVKLRTILCMRFGIGCEEMTLDRIGRSLGVTRERVRQIEVLAIRQLRSMLHGMRDTGHKCAHCGKMIYNGDMCLCAPARYNRSGTGVRVSVAA